MSTQQMNFGSMGDQGQQQEPTNEPPKYQMPPEMFEEIKKFTNYKIAKIRKKDESFQCSNVDYGIFWKLSELEYRNKKLVERVDSLERGLTTLMNRNVNDVVPPSSNNFEDNCIPF